MSALLPLYHQLGFRLLFWERKGNDPNDWKGPRDKGWNDPERPYPIEDYDPEKMNLGVFTGHEIAPGKFLADVDLDWAEGIGLARKILPATGFGFGRKGKRLSHAIYTTSTRSNLSVYDDLSDNAEGENGQRFVELRGGNSSHMTMIAPSLHSPDTYIELAMSESIAHVETIVLEAAVLDYAIACLLFSRVRGGLHHDGRIALAGFLIKSGLSPERVQIIGEEVCAAQMRAFVPDMTGKDVADMGLVVSSTVSRIENNKKVAGAPKLAEFIGERGKEVIARIRKWIGGKPNLLVLNPIAPIETARTFVDKLYQQDKLITLHNQNSVFYKYAPPAYQEVDEPAMRAEMWKFLETALAWTQGKEPSLAPFHPNTSKIGNAMDALKAVTNLPLTLAAPCWLNDSSLNPLEIIACSNGLLHIPDRRLLPPTPSFFTLNGLNYPFTPDASPPKHWLKFLEDLWDDDPETVSTLQETFGYLLTPDTRFQKIMMLIGPKRSGKSLIGRILGKLIGEQNLCSPTLSSFSNSFGKQPLVGKSLALIADARIGGRIDTSAIAETLLSISGEDPQTVERKFLPAWNGKLSTRFVIITNELPKIGDMSGALTSRFIMMLLTRNWFGKEDLGLYDRIEPEMSGILNWALEGRDRLYARKYFIQPTRSEDLLQEFADLSSPSMAFFREAIVGPIKGAFVTTEDLFKLWKLWCADNGIDYPGTAQNFGKSVRASLTYVTMRQVGSRGDQKKAWANLQLTGLWAAKLDGPDNAPPPTDLMEM